MEAKEVMSRKKRARVEGDGVEGRTGITRRRPFVVEVRVPKKVAGAADLKLQFGSYETVNEANVARDFASYLRNSTGQEDRATVGGFCNPDVIFKFEESPEVFESLEGSGSRVQARCDQFKSLLELSSPEEWKKFGEAAREDIALAINLFPSRNPQNFPTPRLNHLPNAEPADGEILRTLPPSSSEARVSPTPGRGVGISMGDGSTSFFGGESLEVQIIVNGSTSQTRRLVNLPLLTAEQILRITEAAIDPMEKILRELADGELVDKLLLELPPCPIDPETIPALE